MFDYKTGMRKKVDRNRHFKDNSKKGVPMSFNAVFQKVKEGYIGIAEELPGANTQGTTLREARINLKEAIRLVLEANKRLAEEEFAGKKVIREKLELSI
jgi:predicted RNase H-like HicB family nuclease